MYDALDNANECGIVMTIGCVHAYTADHVLTHYSYLQTRASSISRMLALASTNIWVKSLTLSAFMLNPKSLPVVAQFIASNPPLQVRHHTIFTLLLMCG